MRLIDELNELQLIYRHNIGTLSALSFYYITQINFKPKYIINNKINCIVEEKNNIRCL